MFLGITSKSLFEVLVHCEVGLWLLAGSHMCEVKGLMGIANSIDSIASAQNTESDAVTCDANGLSGLLSTTSNSVIHLRLAPISKYFKIP